MPRPALTRAGAALAGAGLALAGGGVALGNLELLLLAGLPLLLVVVAAAARGGGTPTADLSLSTRTPRRADPVDIVVDVDVPSRSGLVEIHAPLPPAFALESGTNLALRADGGRHTLRMRVRAHGRGAATLAPVVVETVDPLGVLAPRRHAVTQESSLEITPRPGGAPLRRTARRGAAKLALPDREEARLGVESSDFRELRDYAWGDPPKAINWKSTARRLSASGPGRAGVPLVNEYEREGRKTVLVLLDGGASLRVGTTLESGLDHGIEAALSAARLFLDRGARVGAATFGARAGPPAPPESGRTRTPGLERALAAGEVDPNSTATRVLEILHPHLAGSRPVVIVVTRVTPENASDLAEAARRVRVLLGERRRRLPFVVVDVRALSLAPAPTPAWEAAREFVEREDTAASTRLRASGAQLVVWRPGREDFRAALLRRARA